MTTTRLAAAVVGLVCAAAHAEELTVQEEREAPDAPIKALPCRPTIACTAELVPEGAFEVEAGYGGRGVGGQVTHAFAALVKYSVRRNLQLQLATNNLVLAGPGMAARSLDGVSAGLKVKLWDQGAWQPSAAVSAHLALPTQGLEGAAQRTVDASAWAYLSRDLGPVHADVNAALTVADLGAARATQGLGALALSTELVGGLGAMTEAYGTVGGGAALAPDGGWLNALSWSPSPSVVVDVGLDVGFFPQARAFTVFGGVTFVPGRRDTAAFTRARTPPALVASVGGAP